MQLRVLSAEDVRRALPMAMAIDGMKTAFRQFSAGQATMPLRSRIDVPAVGGVSLFMPAYLSGDASGGTLAVKVVSVFGKNAERGMPTVHGLVLLLEADTGRPLAMLEGATLTAIRTGAASGAATDLLARKDARTLTIFGSGVQARTQLAAVCAVRNIERVWVHSLRRERAAKFVEEMRNCERVPSDLQVADNPQQAVANSDIICTATTSATPVFDGNWLRPGTHINAVGSYTPQMQEVDATTIRKALVAVDSRESVLAEAGDLIIPIQQGCITADHLHAELGEIVAGPKPGRTSPEQITYFKSCGLAVQDAVAAELAYTEAERLGLGTMVSL